MFLKSTTIKKIFTRTIMIGAFTSLLLADNTSEVSVRLPHEVVVGSVTLPAGNYTITALEMGSQQYFRVRGERMSAFVPAEISNTDAAVKTEVIFSNHNDAWRFEKLSIAGSGSYQLLDEK